MQGDQNVACLASVFLPDSDAMAQSAQLRSPPQGGRPVSCAAARRRRTYQKHSHTSHNGSMESSWQTAGYLISALEDSRARTLELIGDLDAERLTVPLLPIINPIVWEIGHVGWFQEKWVLRHLRGEAPMVENADALWDSAAVAHDNRWSLPLLSMDDTLAFLRRLQERVVDRLQSGPLTEDEAYFCWLVIMHEDMHGEALTYTRQTLGYPPPRLQTEAPGVVEPSPKGDVQFAGGAYMLGARPGRRFVFDNEKWRHPVDVKPFAMARSSVTEGQFAEFVTDGGYRRRELWTDPGWEWRGRAQAPHPVYWVRDGRGWCVRRFDRHDKFLHRRQLHGG